MVIIYDLLQWTWGLPQTIVGFIYFSVYPERWANSLGEWVTKQESIGEPV